MTYRALRWVIRRRGGCCHGDVPLTIVLVLDSFSIRGLRHFMLLLLEELKVWGKRLRHDYCSLSRVTQNSVLKPMAHVLFCGPGCSYTFLSVVIEKM